MHIFLVRHAETVENLTDSCSRQIPGHFVSLSEYGKTQAYEAGKFLAKYCEEEKLCLDNARIWRSPYICSRETVAEFNKSLNIQDIKEDTMLADVQYGLFGLVPRREIRNVFPWEYDAYCRMLKTYGSFYTRFPYGESQYDVTLRMQQFIDIIRRDYEKEGIDTLFIFTHGVPLKAFLMRCCGYSPEWFEMENMPKKCWIREVKDHEDCGYIII